MILIAINIIILFAIAVISTAVSNLSIEDLKTEENINEAVNIEIKVFGENGMEWTVKGTSLNIEEPLVYFGKPILKLNGYTIKADYAEVNRIEKEGIMRGNITIRGENLMAEAEEVYLDMDKNLLTGNGFISIKRGNHTIKGKGFTMYLRPFRAIINEADALYSN